MFDSCNQLENTTAVLRGQNQQDYQQSIKSTLDCSLSCTIMGYKEHVVPSYWKKANVVLNRNKQYMAHTDIRTVILEEFTIKNNQSFILQGSRISFLLNSRKIHKNLTHLAGPVKYSQSQYVINLKLLMMYQTVKCAKVISVRNWVPLLYYSLL